MTHRIYLEPLPANPGGFALPGGWYGRPPGVGSENRGIWWRVPERDQAQVMSRASAILTAQSLLEKGYRCRCDPPIKIAYTL